MKELFDEIFEQKNRGENLPVEAKKKILEDSEQVIQACLKAMRKAQIEKWSETDKKLGLQSHKTMTNYVDGQITIGFMTNDGFLVEEIMSAKKILESYGFGKIQVVNTSNEKTRLQAMKIQVDEGDDE